jgi:hypothetical protein
MKNIQDSMVSISTMNRLWTGQPRSHGLFPPGTIVFYLLKGVHTFYEVHPASYLMGIGDFFPRGKAARV